MSFFLALDLDDPVRVEVVRRIEAHRAGLPAKWLRADKLHLTLRFLGHPTPEALAALCALHASLKAADDTRPFVPHLTLARAHTPGALETLEPALRDFTSSPFSASHLTLYESTEAHYRAVHRFDFEAR